VVDSADQAATAAALGADVVVAQGLGTLSITML
jgi:hypothetical protein